MKIKNTLFFREKTFSMPTLKFFQTRGAINFFYPKNAHASRKNKKK